MGLPPVVPREPGQEGPVDQGPHGGRGLRGILHRQAASRHAVADQLLVQAVDDLGGKAGDLAERRHPGGVLDQVDVEQVEVAVALGVDEDRVDQRGDHPVGVVHAGDPLPDADAGPLQGVAHGREEEVLLGLEVVEDHALADARLVGHVLQ
jgi:hypothetical protein